MQSTDLEVLRAASTWLEQGRHVTLVTVVKTWGSSPRPPGSLMALSDDGRISGSVSGGCVEEDLQQRLQASPALARTIQRLRYGDQTQHAQQFSLPCGGVLELVLEPLHHDETLTALLNAVETHQTRVRRLCLNSAQVTLLQEADSEPLRLDGDIVYKTFGPRWRLLIIGANPSAAYLAQLAQTLDYHITLCDPREAYVQSWANEHLPIDTRMPDDCVLAWQPDKHSVIVTLSHDPKLDDMALLEALPSDAFYVGALGSRANNAKRRERLRLLGISDTAIARLHGPTGLHIGARTPPEIALAIMAQVTALRHGIDLRVAQTTDESAKPNARVVA